MSVNCEAIEQIDDDAFTRRKLNRSTQINSQVSFFNSRLRAGLQMKSQLEHRSTAHFTEGVAS